MSRHVSNIENAEDFRRLQRREADHSAKEAAQVAEVEAAEAARQRRLELLKEQYRTYWLHQIKTDIEESKIASLSRWYELPDYTRQEILDICRADPRVRIHGF